MADRPGDIVVRNWGKFQHYKQRNPPWIRLYRDLIDSPEWRLLSDAAARLLVEIWLLSSEVSPGGRVPYDVPLLAWRTGRASTDASIDVSLQELAAQQYIRLPNDASTDASKRASRRTSQRQSTETDTETTLDHADAWPARPRKVDGAYAYPERFEEAWSLYPKRDGSNPKVGAYKAFRARVKDGDSEDDLVASARHYQKHVAGTGKEGTVFVAQAATFWGPSEPWREFVEPQHTNGNGKTPTDPLTFAERERTIWLELGEGNGGR